MKLRHLLLVNRPKERGLGFFFVDSVIPAWKRHADGQPHDGCRISRDISLLEEEGIDSGEDFGA